MNDELNELEANYFDQPAFSQKHDLARINEIRRSLGMSEVDARLRAPAKSVTVRTLKKSKDDNKAAEIYNNYLQRKAFLKPHVEYALEIERATGRTSMTCVQPLATMGTNGGALLCDVCGKPMILEGGRFHGIYADKAWAINPNPKWLSYIKGGMVIHIQNNGTVRIYHGYISNKDDCCSIDERRITALEDKHDKSQLIANCAIVTNFIEREFPDKRSLINDILNTVFGLDLGVGINVPKI